MSRYPLPKEMKEEAEAAGRALRASIEQEVENRLARQLRESGQCPICGNQEDMDHV